MHKRDTQKKKKKEEAVGNRLCFLLANHMDTIEGYDGISGFPLARDKDPHEMRIIITNFAKVHTPQGGTEQDICWVPAIR